MNNNIPIKVSKLHNECYKRIKEMILCGELAWGARIEVGQLANSFGVSKFPVIKAVERLSLEHLVTISPNRGTYVVVPTPDDVFEITDIRIMIEEYACKTAYKKLGSKLAARLKEVESACAFNVDDPSTFTFREFLEYDRQFHFAIIEETGNRRLISYYRTIRSQVEFFRINTFFPPNVTETLINHRQIVDSLEIGDIANAVEFLHHHIIQVNKDTLDSLNKALKNNV